MFFSALHLWQCCTTVQAHDESIGDSLAASFGWLSSSRQTYLQMTDGAQASAGRSVMVWLSAC